MSITITHTWQGFVVGGGNLPANAAWEIFDNHEEALQYATETAEDLDLPLEDKTPALMRRQAE